MVPKAAYWEGVPISKPSATTVKRFIELLDDAKTAFLTALPDDEARAKDLLTGFQELQALQSHIKLHPARESELRSTVSQLVYYANQFAVPPGDRVSFIQGKIRLEISPGIGDVEYFIFQAEIRRIAREMLAVTRAFAGQSLASAFATLFQVVSPDQVVAVTTRERCDPEEVTGTGDTKEAATADAKSKVPLGANIVSTILVNEARNGTDSITAFTESDARRIAAERMPEETTINRVECITPIRKGVLGIGRREGKWEVSWKQPVKVAVSYDSPVYITVQFVPDK
jgi:hypothetical protein